MFPIWCLSINGLFGVSFLAYLPNFCVMLKILSSKVSVDSDITYMSAVKFIACLGVFAYLNLSKNPHLWTDTIW